MAKRLYIVWSSPIFRDSARLLLNHPEVECVGASSDCNSATVAILNLLPDTVLVEKRDGLVPPEIMALLSGGIVQCQIIGVSLSENRVTVFRPESWLISEANDLLTLVLQ